MSRIGRQHESVIPYAVDVVGNLATMAELDVSGSAGVRIYIPAAFSSLTTVTVYDAPRSKKENNGTPYNSGTFSAAQDTSAGAPIVLTVAPGNSYDLPAALFPAAALKLVGNAAGNIDVSLKG